MERESVTLGAVEALQGISWTEVVLEGQANHADTTLMHLMRDTGYCVGPLMVFARKLATDLG